MVSKRPGKEDCLGNRRWSRTPDAADNKREKDQNESLWFSGRRAIAPTGVCVHTLEKRSQTEAGLESPQTTVWQEMKYFSLENPPLSDMLLLCWNDSKTQLPELNGSCHSREVFMAKTENLQEINNQDPPSLYTHTYTHPCTHSHTHTCIHSHTHMHVCIHSHILINMCTLTLTHAHVHTQTLTYIFTCSHASVHTHTLTLIHTCTHHSLNLENAQVSWW